AGRRDAVPRGRDLRDRRGPPRPRQPPGLPGLERDRRGAPGRRADGVRRRDAREPRGLILGAALSTQGDDMNFNSILIGSADPQRLVDYYTKVLGTPGMSDGGYTGWQVGSGFVTVGPHDQV